MKHNTISAMQTHRPTKQERLARAIATLAHAGQTRRDGKTPYVTHPEAVAAAVPKRCKPAAWLHDSLEDCPALTAQMLYDMGVAEATVTAVQALTKHPTAEYRVYVKFVKSNPIARLVKIADIEHNLSQNPNQKNVPKYKEALAFLRGDAGAPAAPKYIRVTAIVCPKCGDKVWSRHRHDYRLCKCGEVAVDGGRDYLRMAFKNAPPKTVKMWVGVEK